MKLNLLIGYVVIGAEARRSRIVIVKFPSRNFSVRIRRAGYLNHARRPEIRPGELFLPRPQHLHRLLCRSRQTGRLQRRITGVLPAIRRPGVRHQHPHLVLRHVKGRRQLPAHPKRPLRPGPHGHLVALPLRYRRPRLQRSVRNIINVVRRLQLVFRRQKHLLHVSRHVARIVPPALGRHMLLQVFEQLLVRRLRFALPLRFDRRHRARRQRRVRRRHPHKIPVPHQDHAGHFFRFARIDRCQRCVKRRRPQYFPVHHFWQPLVRRITMFPGHKIAGIHLRSRLARHLPRARWNERIFRRQQLCDLPSFHQFRIRRRFLCRGIDHLPIVGLQLRRVCLPFLGRNFNQRIARRRRHPPQLQIHHRRGSAPERPHIKRHKLGIAHHQPHRPQRHFQLFRYRLRKGSANVLAHFHLAREHRNLPIFVEVQPRVDFLWQIVFPTPPPPAGFLQPRPRFRCRARHKNSCSHKLEKIPPVRFEQNRRWGMQFIPLRLDVRLLQPFPRHRRASFPVALAFRIAATIRGCVPQRQIFPCIPCTISASLGLGLFFSRDTADIIIPGVQYAHCIAPSSRNACCTGCSRSSVANPSIVTMALPASVAIGVMHDRCARPSISTVHAPHCPSPHPYFVPVRSSCSRSTHSSIASGSARTSYPFPFTRSENVVAIFHLHPQAYSRTPSPPLPRNRVENRTAHALFRQSLSSVSLLLLCTADKLLRISALPFFSLFHSVFYVLVSEQPLSSHIFLTGGRGSLFFGPRTVRWDSRSIQTDDRFRCVESDDSAAFQPSCPKGEPPLCPCLRCPGSEDFA